MMLKVQIFEQLLIQHYLQQHIHNQDILELLMNKQLFDHFLNPLGFLECTVKEFQNLLAQDMKRYLHSIVLLMIEQL